MSDSLDRDSMKEAIDNQRHLANYGNHGNSDSLVPKDHVSDGTGHYDERDNSSCYSCQDAVLEDTRYSQQSSHGRRNPSLRSSHGTSRSRLSWSVLVALIFLVQTTLAWRWRDTQSETKELETQHRLLEFDITDCGCPITCTSTILSRAATDASGTWTCQDRMEYVLMQTNYASQIEACQTVIAEFPLVCGFYECNVAECPDPSASEREIAWATSYNYSSSYNYSYTDDTQFPSATPEPSLQLQEEDDDNVVDDDDETPTPASNPDPTPRPTPATDSEPAPVESPVARPTPFPTRQRTTPAPVQRPPTPSPVADTATPAPIQTTPAPVVSTPAPVVSTPAPVVWTPAPVVSTPAPVVSTPAPIVSTPAPVVSTPAPVRPPTPAPVRPTTPAPTRPPTPRPVATTRSPTRRPTPRPAARPTRQPTRPPSTPRPTPISPESTPVSTPVSNPRPTRKPTRRPTPDPDSGITLSPTPEPTPRPTKRPSTPRPSLRPTFSPTVPNDPTSEPTNLPTSEPTITKDFDFEKITNTIKNVNMEISLTFTRRGRRDLQNLPASNSDMQSTAQCIRLWQDRVVMETEDEINQLVPNIETLDVSLDNITQELEIQTSTLTFAYDVQVAMRSPILEPAMEKYIAGPFDTLAEQTAFADFLRSTNCTVFEYATTVRVILPTNQVAPLQGEPEPASVGPNTGVVVGVVFAAIAVVLIAALYVVQRQRQRHMYPKEPGTPLADMDAQDDGFLLSQIGMRTSSPDGDVSTLSDPLPHITALSAPKDETSTIGSFSLDYDYQKAYQQPSVSDVQSFDEEPRMYISADDETLQKQFASEEHFTVSAPSGTLGLVLESSEDSVPVVSGIRSDSVLFSEVRIGDRLISVDGLDVSDLLTSEVSRLIASKKHQPIRRLVFIRPASQQ